MPTSDVNDDGQTSPPLDGSINAGPIVLYDGVCGLCSRSVRWLMDRDRDRVLRFAPLQGVTCAALRQKFPAIPHNLDSVVLIDNQRVYLRSKVFLYGARYLTRPWRWAYMMRWLPGVLLDLPYRLVASLRYRIWGKFDTCRIPTAKDQRQLLP
jgi:predicted DCC family thiol-disulfide oxidoreductase YuxK